MRKFALALLVLAATASAQVTVEGDAVRQRSGEPLAGVRVILQYEDQANRTVTDATGHFRLTGLSAPHCSLLLDGSGLLPRSQPLTIGKRDTLVTVRISMRPQAVISGTVLDEAGWPIARAMVTAAQYISINGRRELSPVQRAQTDDRGVYRLAKLPPGRYYVRVRAMELQPRFEHPPIWYPAALTESGARPIDLAEGQEASGMNVSLTRGGVEVRGRVAAPAGMQSFLSVRWIEFGYFTGSYPAAPLPDGSFTLRHLAPGPYILTAGTSAFMDGSVAPAYSVTEVLNVGADNIEGVALNIGATPLGEIKGTLSGDGAIRPEQVRVFLQPSLVSGQLTAKVQPDGTFVIPGVWPGSYRVNVSAPGGRAESVRFGDREIVNQPFDYEGGDTALRITVRDYGKLVGVAGTLTDSNHVPIIGARILFVASGPTYSRYANPGSASTDQNGAIRAVLLPGTYRAYVIPDPLQTEQLMDNAAFRQQQEQAIPPVEIKAGDTPPLRIVLPAL